MKIIIIILILFSVIAQSFLLNDSVIAQSSKGQELSKQGNWEFINHNVRGTNYSPQNQINSENAHMLELKWTYPIPNVKFNEQEGISSTQGSMTPPLIINGTVYFTTNMRDTYAINSSTGNLKWINTWDFDWQEAYRKLPITGGALHVHGLNLINGKLFPSTVACSILAINPEDGEINFELKETCRSIEGNAVSYTHLTLPTILLV